MPGQTFLLYHVGTLPAKGTFATPKRRPAQWRDYQSDPVYTSLQLGTGPPLFGYVPGQARHRRVVPIVGLVRGEAVSEVIEEKIFRVFYKPRRSIFIAATQRSLGMAATNRLARELENIGPFIAAEIDFERITSRTKNILGVWFRRNSNNRHIHREAAYGDHVNDAREYERMTREGELTSITAVIEFRGNILRIRFSKFGSVSFLDDLPPETCLAYLESLLDEQIATIPVPEGGHRAAQRRA